MRAVEFGTPPSRLLKPAQAAVVRGDDILEVADVHTGIVVIVSDGAGVTAIATPVFARDKEGCRVETATLLDHALRKLGSLHHARAAIIGCAPDQRSRLLPTRVRMLLQARRIPVVLEQLDGRFGMVQVDGFGLITDKVLGHSVPLNAARVTRRVACRADELGGGSMLAGDAAAV